MPKNLLFIHLESISQAAFWQYSAEMETLFSLMRRSLSFSRFYAASTSSVMSMADLLHGDSSELDHLEAFPKDRSSLLGKSGNLFDILAGNGYAAYGLQYGSFCLGDAPNNFWGIWPESCGQFASHRDRETMHREIRDRLEKSRAAGKPFAMYFWNMNTHLRDEDPLKDKDLPYHARFQAGYRLLDMSVKRLLGDLSNLGMLRDTLIVAFGDHGDDLWRHGIYRGRSHIIDPYANVCWCPLFIFNDERDIGVASRLASMIDLKATLCRMLLPDWEAGSPATPFSGGDLHAGSRESAFTQSMFALQRERSDPAQAITKSYAVTDGDFRLMASNPADAGDSGGLELYHERWDYGNDVNLLDFFRLDDAGGIVARDVRDAGHSHAAVAFSREVADHAMEAYEKLRRLLYSFVKLKEREAAKYFKGGDRNLFPDAMFGHSRKREK